MKTSSIKQLLFYLFNVRGCTVIDELRLLLAILRYTTISFLKGRRTYLGLYIPGSKVLKIRTSDGYQFFIRPKTTDLALALLYTHEPYELNKWFLPYARGVVIDVGANVGGYTVRACRQADLVVSIEPQLEVFKMLRKNVELNCHKNNVILIKKAISDRVGKTLIRIPKKKKLMFSGEAFLNNVKENEYFEQDFNFEYEEVELDTLDNIVNSLSIPKIDFLKVDIEGYEGIAFKGMINTLKKTKYLMIEIKPKNKWLLENLLELGYKKVDQNNNNYFLINTSIN